LERTISKAINVLVISFQYLWTRGKRLRTLRANREETVIFVASIADINKALAVKQYTDPKTKMPAHFHE
jgi:hypothetical protein